MYSIITLVLSSFLLSLVLSPFCRDFALRRGLVDKPEGGRKTHENAVPRSEAWRLSSPAALPWDYSCSAPLDASRADLGAIPFVVKPVPKLLLVFAIGLADDIFGLKPFEYRVSVRQHSLIA